MLVASEGTMLGGTMAAYSLEDGMDRPVEVPIEELVLQTAAFGIFGGDPV